MNSSFLNKEQIRNRNVDTPGVAYFKKVCDFYNAHYTRGKLYLEYVKDCCETRTGHQCQFCQSNPWTSSLKGVKNNKVTRIMAHISLSTINGPNKNS